MKKLKYLLTILAVLSFFTVFSQTGTAGSFVQKEAVSNSKTAAVDSTGQRDLIDILKKIFDKKSSPEKRKPPKKAIYSVIPYIGYSLSSGFSANISGNVVFYTNANHHENLSVIAGGFSYDVKSQKVFITRSEIWANENNYKIVSDLRWERYPTDSYGLGTFTTFANDDKLDFNHVKVYETVLKKIGTDYYAGIGYNLDYHYNITATGNADKSVTDFVKYGEKPVSTSSGVNLSFLYDKRKNPLNPLGGAYASIVFRQNLTFLGSDANWRSLQFDFRKYLKLSPNSNNVLALWSIAAFTSGNVPYLDLPSTGADMYNNSGRGYATGRFRGKNELYAEAEYRFRITGNGLLGAVVFANGESFSEYPNNAFERIAPAVGTGIRIKLNKRSNTNICIDYGVGTGGSRGFFINLGELF